MSSFRNRKEAEIFRLTAGTGPNTFKQLQADKLLNALLQREKSVFDLNQLKDATIFSANVQAGGTENRFRQAGAKTGLSESILGGLQDEIKK